MVGGAYHPAFRELCESRLIREKVDRELGSFAAGSRILLRVSSKDVSRTVGQKAGKSSALAADGLSGDSPRG